MTTRTLTTLPFDGFCVACGEVLPKGTEVIHVPGCGLCHPECERDCPDESPTREGVPDPTVAP